MDTRINTLGINSNEAEFNAIQFEKRLMQLKDSQESINSLSAWCLENRQHHKKIVNAWLNVLKKVKVEHRLTLFYLANDVIQYSKRKNYDFVESWGTTLQKATTMVREEKVKTRILRIFKIWEQRGIYGEEFITDLSGLISASPAGRKLDQDPHDFQPTYLISRIRSCAKLESDTDLKLKLLKDGNPKVPDSEILCASLKDRKQVQNVEREVENSIRLIEGYVNALKAEIKSRTHVVALLTQADTFYTTERKEVKVVVGAYKNFTTRVKNLQKKLDETIPTLTSPIPSPDVNAPSPEPDSDIELPNHDSGIPLIDNSIKCAFTSGVNVYSISETYNAGYYTPAPSQNQQTFTNNGFSSFLGSNMPFDLQNFNTGNIFADTQHTNSSYTSSVATTHEVQSHLGGLVAPQQHAAEPTVDYTQPVLNYNQQVESQSVIQQQPLLPPPMPPFTTSGYMDTAPYTDTTYASSIDSYASNSTYQAVGSVPYAVSSEVQGSYPPAADAYNPEEDVETWEPETTWDVPDLETPESPPIYEKEGFADPIEYDDSKITIPGLGKDVDHRVLLPPPQMPSQLSDSGTGHIMSRQSSKDVDHRNLISLTGSPGREQHSATLPPPPAPPALWTGHGDQDYRNSMQMQDQDYRVPVDIAQQLKLPPPPPPPPKASFNKKLNNHDNVESIDMELSDDETSSTPILSVTSSASASPAHDAPSAGGARKPRASSNKKIPTLIGQALESGLLEPPPPIPQNLCEMSDASAPGTAAEPEPSEAGKVENGLEPSVDAPSIQLQDGLLGPGPPPIPQLCELGGQPLNAGGWPVDDWFDGRPPADFQDRDFLPPSFPGRHKLEFRGGYRGRGRGGVFLEHADLMFRGRARGRVMRGRPMRGPALRGFGGRPPRTFRTPFRSSF